MKVKLLLFFSLLIFVILLAGCNQDSGILTLEEITTSFSKAELHLKPQADAEYPELNGVKPSAYELLDDNLYIYVYNSENDLIKGLEELKQKGKFRLQPKTFKAKNVLILYISLLPPEQNFESKINEILESIKY